MAQEITKEWIQEILNITHVDEEAYLNELVAYQLHFEDLYDQLIGKLDKVHVNFFKGVHMCKQLMWL
jgi:beta-lactamase class D